MLKSVKQMMVACSILTSLSLSPILSNKAVAGEIDAYNVGDLEIKILSYDSDRAAHPGIDIAVPQGYRILGGGARVNWFGQGSLLTSIWPNNYQYWSATAKDHILPDHATVSAYAIIGRMSNGQPISNDDYIIVEQTSVPASHPQTQVVLPYGFTLVGGGARVNWSGEGNMLTASYPDGNSWVARAKDHQKSSVATVTAFAIGLRDSFLASHGIRVQQKRVTSGTGTSWPSTSCSLDYGYRLLSGGAETHWYGAGQLLTASFPQDRHTWTVSSKDHDSPDFGHVTAHCVGISF